LGTEEKGVKPEAAIPIELEPLAEEARKYKTPEEFKNAIQQISKREKKLTKSEEELRSKIVTTSRGTTPLLEAYSKRFGDFSKTYIDFYNQATGAKAAEEKGVKPEATIPKEPWQMTREEFIKNPPKEVEIFLVEGKPPLRGRIGSSPDFMGGKPDIGYRVANTITPFETAHRNLVKQAYREGKPVPPEILKELGLSTVTETKRRNSTRHEARGNSSIKIGN